MPYTAKVTFTYPLPDGGMGWVRAGQVLGENDAAVRGREALFDHEAPAKPVVAKRAVKRKAD